MDYVYYVAMVTDGLGYANQCIYHKNHVKLVYIFRYTPARFRSYLLMISLTGCWPREIYIKNKFLPAGVHLTYTPHGHGLYTSVKTFPLKC